MTHDRADQRRDGVYPQQPSWTRVGLTVAGFVVIFAVAQISGV
jgi:hypothetical protein